MSNLIDQITSEQLRNDVPEGKVRRAKLFYLRDLHGKAARIPERRRKQK